MLQAANPSTHKPSGVEALLFDLGGVLIDIDFERVFHRWQHLSPLSVAEMRQSFKFDDAYEKHERGELDAAEYFSHLRTELKLQGSDKQIADGWNAVFIQEIEESMEMVRAARAAVPCFVFTNTNATHKAAWSARFPAFAQSFDGVFASHEIGLRKPGRRAFDHVVTAVGVPPRAILFFDDLLENVEGAAAAGMQSVHVRGPRDVRNALRHAGIIS